MKRITIIAAMLFTSSLLFAQSVELTPIYAYTFSGKADGYYGSSDVVDNPSYGGILDIEVDHLSYVELSYIRNDTRLNVRSYGSGAISGTYDIGVEHYQVGVLREFSEDKLRPYAKVSLGTSRYFAKNSNDRYWLFSGAIGVGAKFFFNDKVGLRLYTNLMLPMEFAGGGIFCGIGGGGGGCSTGVTFNVPLVHWDMGAGLIIRLPN